MAWTQVQQVPSGAVIQVGDNRYTVVKNSFSDLLVQSTRKPFPQSLKTIVEGQGDDWEGYKHEVFVESTPVPQSRTGATLHAQIQARFAPKGPSLKEQLEQRHSARNVVARADHIHAPAYATRSHVEQVARGAVDGIAHLRTQLSSVASRANTAQYQAAAVSDSVESLRGEVVEFSDEVADDVSDLEYRIGNLEHQALETKINQDLGKSKGGISVSIKKLLGGFTNQFGKVEGQFALSPVGIAVRSNPNSPAPSWVAYDAKSGVITDVQGAVLDFNIPAFRLPVEPSAVNVGDIVINDGKYQYVVEKNDDYLTTVSPASRSRGTVLPTKNIFLGKTFYTVVKTLDLAGQAGFNPMLLMAMGKGDKSDLLPFLLASGGITGGAAGAAGGIDPTMLMLLGDNTDDLLPFILMQQGGVAPQGFNPLMLLALSGDKGGSSMDKLLPLLLMGQGGAGGAGLQSMLPFLLMGDKSDGGSGLSDILMMQALSGQGGANPLAGLFGGAAPAASTVAAPKATDSK